jgi:hypothetical protein
MAGPSKQRLWGCLIALVGLLTAVLIHRHPDRLHAPVWVAYAACAAFVFCGLSVGIGGPGRGRLQSWLAVALVGSMLVVGSWAAFGPGERACTISIPMLGAQGSELACRGAFGAGSIITAALLVWIVVRAVRGADPKREEAEP